MQCKKTWVRVTFQKLRGNMKMTSCAPILLKCQPSLGWNKQEGEQVLCLAILHCHFSPPIMCSVLPNIILAPMAALLNISSRAQIYLIWFPSRRISSKNPKAEFEGHRPSTVTPWPPVPVLGKTRSGYLVNTSVVSIPFHLISPSHFCKTLFLLLLFFKPTITYIFLQSFLAINTVGILFP